jgi:hypothetical protein
MANLVILTDTSLEMDENHVLNVRLSKQSTNRLTFNDKQELTLKKVDVKGYLPLNGLVGEPDVPMERISCDSSVTRIANWNDANGDVNEKGITGDKDHDGVNIIGLFTALGKLSGSDMIYFWDKKSYANSTTPTYDGSNWD